MVPRLFAIEIDDPRTGARIQIGEPAEADAIRELLGGDVPELPPAIHQHMHSAPIGKDRGGFASFGSAGPAL